MSIDGSAAPSTGRDVSMADAEAGAHTPTDDTPASPIADGPTPSVAPPVTTSVWRYHLDVLVGEAAGSKVWQATDPVLGRRVGVRLLPAADDRADDLREAACLAARVADRRLIHVLDVVDVRFDGVPHLAIVTEWVAGRPLTEVLREPMASPEALRLVADVAECLASCHDDGIAHGRLRPSSVLLTDTGDVRVRGVGVDAVLRGCDPDPDPAVSDIRAVGGLLYACSTGRWPYGEVEGLAAAPEMGGGVPLPSRVAPAVSPVVDSLCSRTVSGCPPPKEGEPIRRMAVLASALRAAAGVARDTPTPASQPRRPRRVARRLVAAVAGLAAVAGIAIYGWQLVREAPSAITPRSSAGSLTPSAPISSTAPAPQAKVDKPLAIIRVSDFDPLGNGNENSDQAAAATDGSAATAWTTVRYRADYLSGKEGVGLLLDLGAPRPISAVRLSLVGSGTDVQVLTADRPDQDLRSYRKFASATSVPDEIVLRSPSPVTSRYVLVWLTRIPAQSDGGYQGGVSEVAVLG